MTTLTATRATRRVWFTRDALGGVVAGFGTDGADDATWSAYRAVLRGKMVEAVAVLERGGYTVALETP